MRRYRVDQLTTVGFLMLMVENPGSDIVAGEMWEAARRLLMHLAPLCADATSCEVEQEVTIQVRLHLAIEALITSSDFAMP